MNRRIKNYFNTLTIPQKLANHNFAATDNESVLQENRKTVTVGRDKEKGSVSRGLMITSALPVPSFKTVCAEMLRSARVPPRVICIETSRRGEAVGFRAKSDRDSTSKSGG